MFLSHAQLHKLAQEKGASNWLFCLPLKSHNFVLHKTTFRDAVQCISLSSASALLYLLCLWSIEHALSWVSFFIMKHGMKPPTYFLRSTTMSSLNPTLYGETLQIQTANHDDDNACLTLQLNFGEEDLRGNTLHDITLLCTLKSPSSFCISTS